LAGSVPYPLVHLELHTSELAGARTFYAELCGWREEEVRMPCGSYVAIDLGRRLSGGMVECPIERPIWLPYVEVPQIGAATERARLCGAAVLLEPREGPAGWRSVLRTAVGGEVAFWQPKR
jgi:predicted enzyme related to lactoylglutathione lyase